MDSWKTTPELSELLHLPSAESPQRISSALSAALAALVTLAGGWTTRPCAPRPAYASTLLLKLRTTVEFLARCEALLRREAGVGSFSTLLVRQLGKLEHQGLSPPTSSRSATLLWLRATPGHPRP